MSEFTTRSAAPGPGSDPLSDPLAAPTGSSEASTHEVAADEAKTVASDAQQAGAHVAGTTKDQAAEVAGDAKDQARRLMDEARSELNSQAASQGQRAASSLHSLADELEQMQASTPSDGYTAHLVGPAAQHTRDLARWLEHREPGEVLQELRSYARRRPGLFLLGAAAAGVVAGRLTRGMIDEHRDDASTTGSASHRSAGTDDVSGAVSATPAGYGGTAASPAAPPTTSETGSPWGDEGGLGGREDLGGPGTRDPLTADLPTGDPEGGLR